MVLLSALMMQLDAENKEPPAAHKSLPRSEVMLVEISNSEVSRATRESIDRMQTVMSKMPQAPGMDTTHFFAGGMYCRRIAIPAGNVIVSKTHKTEHLFIGCVGELAVAGQGENYILRPGDVMPSPVGTKRAVTALSDVVVMTIHKTDITSVDELEAELMEDGFSMYDVNNQPKPDVLVGSLFPEIGD